MPNSHGVSHRRIEARPCVVVTASTLLVSFLGVRVVVAATRSADSPSRSREVQTRDEQTKTILLVRSTGDERLMLALRTEVDARRWHIVELQSPGGNRSLTQTMRESGASAAVRYDTDSAEIQLSASIGPRTVEDVLRNDDGSGVEILALRAVETLRAHGLDLGSYDTQTAADRSPPPKADPHRAAVLGRVDATNREGTAAAGALQSRAHSSELWLELAPNMLESSGGWTAAALAWVGLRLQFSAGFSLSAVSALPLSSQKISANEGNARVDTTLLGASVSSSLFQRDRWSSSFGFGASALVTRMHGSAQPGYVGVDEVVVTQAPHMSLGFAFAAHDGWQVFSSILGGVSIPRVSVLFDDRLARAWGRPFALIGLGIAMRTASW